MLKKLDFKKISLDIYNDISKKWEENNKIKKEALEKIINIQEEANRKSGYNYLFNNQLKLELINLDTWKNKMINAYLETELKIIQLKLKTPQALKISLFFYNYIIFLIRKS